MNSYAVRFVRWVFKLSGPTAAALVCLLLLAGNACPGSRPTNPAPAGTIWREPFSGMEFVKIAGGCFQMGQTPQGREQIISARGERHYRTLFRDEHSRHEICVDDFWLGRHEVTNRQYRHYRPAHANRDYEGRDIDGDDQPAVNVNWHEAQAYARWLSQKVGRSFRLPTEAEWEYGCRAGTTTVRFWGDDATDACRYANTHDRRSKRENPITWPHHDCEDGYAVASPAGRFKPNAFGLYDMLGNIWEWCRDVHPQPADQANDRRHAPASRRRDLRIIRGGSWASAPAYVRCATRYKTSVDTREYIVGFRLVVDRFPHNYRPIKQSILSPSEKAIYPIEK